MNQKSSVEILIKDLARLWETRLEVYDETKYSGDKTGEDKGCVQIQGQHPSECVFEVQLHH